MTKPLHVTRAQAKRLERNLSGVPRRKTTPDIGDIMTACQSAAAMALDMAGVKGKPRRVLISPEFNQHCLKASRDLAAKMAKKL